MVQLLSYFDASMTEKDTVFLPGAGNYMAILRMEIDHVELRMRININIKHQLAYGS